MDETTIAAILVGLILLVAVTGSVEALGLGAAAILVPLAAKDGH